MSYNGLGDLVFATTSLVLGKLGRCTSDRPIIHEAAYHSPTMTLRLVTDSR